MNMAHLFTDVFTVQSQSSSNASGDPIWSASRTVKGIQSKVTRRVVSPQGESFVQVDIFETDQPILIGDRYWPPGADTSNDRQAKTFAMVTSRSLLNRSYTLYRADL